MPFCLQPQDILHRNDDTVRVTIQREMDEQIVEIAFAIVAVMEEPAAT